MEQLLEAYQNLLDVYTKEVKDLELRKKEAGTSWVSYKVLNSRMFYFDEHLRNVYHGGFGYEEKNRVMPFLLKFISLYETSSEEQKKLFENQKTTNEYQQCLDELLSGKYPFTEFLQSQLKEIQHQEARCKMPYPPQRSNATRQQAVYRKEMSDYEEKLNSLSKCRREVEERVSLYESLMNN